MCEPISLMATTLALSAASAVAQYQAAGSEAQAQEAYQKAQMKAHQEAALKNANSAINEQVEQTAAERIQQMQQNQAGAREMQKAQSEYLQKRGAAIASSPNAGGLSFDALMADYDRALASNRDVIQEQLDMYGVGADINISGYKDKAHNRIHSQQGYISSPINKPSGFAAALGFGSSALSTINAATDYGKNNPFKTKTVK